MLFAFCFNYLITTVDSDFTLNSGALRIAYFSIFTLFNVISLFILRNKAYLLPRIEIPQFKSIFLTLFLCLIPFCSIIGAVTLNNGGTNATTVLMLTMICLATLGFAFFEKNIPPFVYPLSIFCFSISLLFMYSLRSNYVVGWDVHQEFMVFQLTKNLGEWNMSNFFSAYNAMLSITLFPTVLSNLTKIPDLYLFKAVIPLLFGMTPILIYEINRLFVKKYYAFLAAFFFMAQFQFMSQMPALNRQAVAFLFFAALLYVLLNKAFSKFQRTALFVIFSSGLIVSHYSTAYITLLLLITVYIATLAFNLLKRVINNFRQNELKIENRTLSIWMVLFFTLFSVFWYGYYTKISNDVGNLLDKLAANFNKFYSQELKSEQARYAIWGTGKLYSDVELKLYNEGISSDYRLDKSWATYYPSEVVSSYPITPMYAQVAAINNQKAKVVADQLFEIVKKSLKTLMLIGLLAMGFLFFRANRRKKISVELLVLSSTSFVLLTMLAFLPILSEYYNFERLYQQTLMVLSTSLIFGISLIAFGKKILVKVLLTTLILAYYLNYSGLISVYVGGPVGLNLFNFGEDYDRFYSHASELTAAKWYEKNTDVKAVIALDRYAHLRFQSATTRSQGYLTDVIPSVIPQYSYVFSSYANTVTGIARTSYKNVFLAHNFPFDFLDDNKDLIYSAKTSRIYK